MQHQLYVVIQPQAESKNEYDGVFTSGMLFYDRLRDLGLFCQDPSHQCTMVVPGGGDNVQDPTNFGTPSQTARYDEWTKHMHEEQQLHKRRLEEREQASRDQKARRARSVDVGVADADAEELDRLDEQIDEQIEATRVKKRRRLRGDETGAVEQPSFKGRQEATEHANRVRGGAHSSELSSDKQLDEGVEPIAGDDNDVLEAKAAGGNKKQRVGDGSSQTKLKMKRRRRRRRSRNRLTIGRHSRV